VQSIAAGHAIETDSCVVDVGYTCCHILVMVGDPASKSGNTDSWLMPVLPKRIPRRLFIFHH